MDSTPKPGPGIAGGPTTPTPPATPPTPTLEERVTSLEDWRKAASTPAGPLPFAPRPGWYKPNDTEISRFAQKHTIPAATPGVQYVIEPTSELEEAVARAAFGYQPSGLRAVYGVFDLDRARAFCDRLAAAPSAKDADDILQGAGSMDTDAACYLVMTGAARFPGLGGSGSVGLGGATTIAQAVAAYLAQKTPGPGPGPSGR